MLLIPASQLQEMKIGDEIEIENKGIVTIVDLAIGRITFQNKDGSFFEELVWGVVDKNF